MSTISPFFRFAGRMSKYAPHRVHHALYRMTGGKIGKSMPGSKLEVLLLTTTGRKSGLPRTHPVMFYRDGQDLVILASNSGDDRPPQWYLNLKANSEVTVQIGSETRAVTAVEATEAERRRLWPLLKAIHPIFAAYETFTDRQLPVIQLRPR